MKVVKKGKGWSKQQECTGVGNGDGGCGSTLEFEPRDIFLTERTFMGRDYESYFTIECPECGALTDLKKNDIPRRFHEDIKPRGKDNGEK